MVQEIRKVINVFKYIWKHYKWTFVKLIFTSLIVNWMNVWYTKEFSEPLIIYNSKLPSSVYTKGLTLFPFIFLNVSKLDNSTEAMAVLAHELEHFNQIKRFSYMKMYQGYSMEWTLNSLWGRYKHGYFDFKWANNQVSYEQNAINLSRASKTE